MIRSLQKIVRLLGFCVLLVLLLAGIAIATVTLTGPGRAKLAQWLSGAASTPSRSIAIGGIDGIWTGKLRVDRVLIGDRTGDWLDVTDLRIDWSPSALLARRFEAGSVSAAKVTVFNTPAPAPAAEGADGDQALALPVGIDIAAIDLPAVELRPAVLGRAVALAAKGNLAIDRSLTSIITAGRLVRTDASAGNLVFDLRYRPGEGVFDVNLQGSEPDGGLVAGLLGLPGTPQVDMAVSGQGSLSDWKGTGTLSVDGAVVTRIAAEHQVEAGRRRITARGDGDFQRLLPERWRPLAAGQAAFDIAGLLADGPVLTIERADIRSETIEAEASGVLTTAGDNNLRLRATARGDAVPVVIDGIDVRLQGLEAAVSGPAEAARIEARAALAAIAAPQSALTGVDATLTSTGMDLGARTGPFTLALAARDVSSPAPVLERLAGNPLDVIVNGRLAGDIAVIDSAVMTLGGLRAEARGEIGIAAQALDLTVTASAPPGLLDPAIERLTTEPVTVSAHVARTAAGRLSVADLVLAAGDARLTGRGELADGNLSATIDGRVAELARLDPGLAGAADLAVRLNGPVAAPKFEVTVSSAQVVAAGRAVQDVMLKASGTADPAAPAARLDLSARLAGQPVTAATTLRQDEAQLQLADIAIAAAGARVAGQLALTENFLPVGALTLDAPDIAPLARLAGQDMTGAASATIDFAVNDAVPQVTARMQLPVLKRDPVEVRGATVDLTVDDYLLTRRARGTVRLNTLVAGALEAEDLALDITHRDGRADVTVRHRDAFVTSLSAEYSRRGDALAVTVNGEGDFGQLLIEQARHLLADSAAYRIALTVNDNGSVFIDEATLRSEALGLSASGLIDPSASSDLKLRLEGRGAAVPFNYGQFKTALTGFDLALSGRLEQMRIDTQAGFKTLVTDHIRLDTVTMQITSNGFDVLNRTGPLALKAEARRFESPLPVVSRLNGQPAGLIAEGTLHANRAELASATLTSLDTRLAVRGSADLKDGSLDLALDGLVPSDAVAPGLAAAAGDMLAVRAGVVRSGEGAIDVSGIEAAGGGLRVTGSARLAGDAIAADLSGSLDDVARLAPKAKGSLAVTAKLSGDPAKPRFDVAGKSARIAVGGRTITDLALTATGTADLAAPEARIGLTGDIDGVPLTGSARLGLKDGTRQLGDISIANGQNRITGNLVLDDRFVPTGTLDFDVPDVAPLAALALQTVKGAIAGSVSFGTGNGKPQIAIDVRSTGLEHPAATIGDATVTGTIRDYLEAPSLAGTVAARTVRAGGATISGLSVDLARDEGGTGFDGSATVNGMPITAAGRVKPDGDTITIELKSAGVTHSGLEATLARPSTIVVKDATAMLDKLPLSVGGGSVVVDGSAGATLALDVTIDAVPASIINRFASGLDAGGSISGSARITGKAASPDVDYNLVWTGARLSQLSDAGFDSIDIVSKGTLRDRVVRFDVRLSDSSGLAMTGGGSYALAAPGTLDVTLDGRLPFSFLAARLAEQGLSLTGTADLELRVTGSAAAPQITGSIRTSGARFVDAATGIALNDLTGTIDVGGNVARIARLTGTLSSGGTVSAGGTIGIAPDGGFPADLTIRIDKGRYVDGRLIATRFTGDLTITGSLIASPVLAGRIKLEKTTITVPESLPRSLSQLNVTHQNASGKVLKQAAALRPAKAEGSSGGLVLDLQIDAPRRIFVRGRGLDAELGGSIRLTGPSASPSAVGSFKLRRGRLSILGKRLDFTRGTIGFSGSLIPDLNLAAESRTGTTTVTVTVSGPADNPRFSFSSSPAAPEDEVLAQLIFGRSVSKLSPLQVVQLADAASSLAGGGGSSLLSSLRNQIGIDDIDIKTDDKTGESSVAIGKYINNRTYLSLEKGAQAGSGKAAIDLNIGRGVKLHGEVNELGEAKAGIFYEKEY